MAWFDLGSSYEDPDEGTTYQENGEKTDNPTGNGENIQVGSFSENGEKRNSVKELVKEIEQKITNKKVSRQERLKMIREVLTGQPAEIQRRVLKRAPLDESPEKIIENIETTGNELNRAEKLAQKPQSEGVSKAGQKDIEPYSQEDKKTGYSRSSGHSNADAVNAEDKKKDKQYKKAREEKYGEGGDPRSSNYPDW